MRELKFRVYTDLFDDLKERMIYDGIGYQTEDGWTICNGGYECTDLKEDLETLCICEVMQYTGIKDKNGVEIYEGDVLASGVYVTKPVEVKWDNGLCSYQLESSSSSEHFLDYSGENDLGYNPWIIVGNIYENPELISNK